MSYYADIHIHSHFSVATSKNLVPEMLEYWARLKGVTLIGTGDCIHPGWSAELKEKLESADNGFFRLKDQFRLRESRELHHDNIPREVFFIPTGEISTIYKKDGRTRKVHSICGFPDFETVARLQDRLDRIGNIRSDGRPILGLDTRDLLEMVLETGQGSFLIPAHIWTPWFSVLGSKSGFDSLEECFGDLGSHIFAVETGLSSDPVMNRTCSFLDRYTLVSNSDAHSPEKLGREANVLDTTLDFDSFLSALSGRGGHEGTVEFFPQEGKYHYDGHRKCGVCWNPMDTELHDGLCPVCGREVTRGVMYRVSELSDRDAADIGDCNCHYITQLPDILAEMLGQKNSSSKKVMEMYHRIVRSAGSEFFLLLEAGRDQLEDAGCEMLADGIMRLRRGEVTVEDGYDGEFGKIRVFTGTVTHGRDGSGLFDEALSRCGDARADISTIRFDITRFREMRMERSVKDTGRPGAYTPSWHDILSTEQQGPVRYQGGPCLVIAGPGTGKTRVLTERIRYLVKNGLAGPGEILAVTFSNRAARELKERLGGESCDGIIVSTLHYLGLTMLREHHGQFGRTAAFSIIDEDERYAVLSSLSPSRRDVKILDKMVSSYKNGTGEKPGIYDDYEARCREKDLFDLDDLVFLPAELLCGTKEFAGNYRRRFLHLMVDEFQDINAVQYRMIRSLCSETGENLFAIGDPDQSIYGFRGAGPNFLESIAKDYPGTEVFTLTRSYRCPSPVLLSARRMIRRSEVMDGVDSEIRIGIGSMESSRSEADWIAAAIESAMGGTRSFSRDSGMSDGSGEKADSDFSDYAVLCRSSFMFDELSEALDNHGIPHQVIDNVPFYRKGDFAESVDRLRRCLNRTDETHGECYVCASIRNGRTVSEILENLLREKGITEQGIMMIRQLSDPYGDDFIEFLRSVRIGMGADDYDAVSATVKVMTIHQSKGLEFDTVFIPGCEEGIIPFTMFGQAGDDYLAEEERLLYVAMTRSQRRLYLTYAGTRRYRERKLIQKKSRFMDRFEEKYLHLMIREPLKKEWDDQLSLF